MTTIILFCLVSPALSLRLLTSPTALCGDPEIDLLVAPISRDFLEFFESQHYTLYPIAVSAVGALRYGGNSVVVDGERHILDHDVDFLFVGPPGSELDEDTARLTWRQAKMHVTNKGWREIPGDNQLIIPNDIASRLLADLRFDRYTHSGNTNMSKAPTDTKGRRLFVIEALIFSAKPNALSKGFSHEFIHEMGVENAKSLTPAALGSAIDWVDDITRPIAVMGDAMEPSNPPPSLHFDLFSILGPQAELQPHPTKKMFFHGLEMRYPSDASLAVSSLQMAFWNIHSRDATTARRGDICAFSLPGAFQDDMPQSLENKRVAMTCSASLKANGYESFSTLGCFH